MNSDPIRIEVEEEVGDAKISYAVEATSRGDALDVLVDVMEVAGDD